MSKLRHEFYNKYLPIYLNIPRTKFELAIWSEESNWCSTRITIRDRFTSTWLATIKPGSYGDRIRKSKNFWVKWRTWKDPELTQANDRVG